MPEELEEEEEDNQFRRARLEKLAGLQALGVDAYPYGFARSHDAATLERRHADLPNGAVTAERVAIAGRVRANRNSGMFIDLHDMSGKIQIFSHKDFLAPDQLAVVKLLDLGDFIGVEGIVRRTPRGELTINADRVTVLAKALLPLPEKFHGLADLETRYRQRYLELNEAYADYTDMMAITEALVAAAALAAGGATRIAYGGTEIDLTPPWPRRSMAELVKDKTGVDFLAVDNAKAAVAA